MLIGYVRVSKADGSQTTAMQRDSLLEAGVKEENIYQDYASGKLEKRPQLDSCLKALREGDTLVVWKLDRLGRSVKHLVSIIEDLQDRQVGFKVLTGLGASIDTTSPAGKLIFSIFAALAEFERELIIERTRAGLAAARARGRKGGAPFKMTRDKLRMAQASMKQQETNVGELCRVLGITRSTLYRYVGPDGKIREDGKKLLEGKE